MVGCCCSFGFFKTKRTYQVYTNPAYNESKKKVKESYKPSIKLKRASKENISARAQDNEGFDPDELEQQPPGEVPMDLYHMDANGIDLDYTTNNNKNPAKDGVDAKDTKDVDSHSGLDVDGANKSIDQCSNADSVDINNIEINDADSDHHEIHKENVGDSETKHAHVVPNYTRKQSNDSSNLNGSDNVDVESGSQASSTANTNAEGVAQDISDNINFDVNGQNGSSYFATPYGTEPKRPSGNSLQRSSQNSSQRSSQRSAHTISSISSSHNDLASNHVISDSNNDDDDDDGCGITVIKVVKLESNHSDSESKDGVGENQMPSKDDIAKVPEERENQIFYAEVNEVEEETTYTLADDSDYLVTSTSVTVHGNNKTAKDGTTNMSDISSSTSSSMDDEEIQKMMEDSPDENEPEVNKHLENADEIIQDKRNNTVNSIGYPSVMLDTLTDNTIKHTVDSELQEQERSVVHIIPPIEFQSQDYEGTYDFL